VFGGFGALGRAGRTRLRTDNAVSHGSWVEIGCGQPGKSDPVLSENALSAFGKNAERS
jgi:hypothetical protein